MLLPTALGSVFDIPHGAPTVFFFFHSLLITAKIPQKFTVVSTYPLWIADEKYARAAQFLNLPPEQNGA